MNNISQNIIMERGLISVSGPDGAKFLHGLLSNDIHKATNDSWIYALFLTPKGRIIVDLFIKRDHEGFVLDCPGSEIEAVVNKMKFYRLRSKVEIVHIPGWIQISQTGDMADPRHRALGCRSIVAQPSAVPDYYQQNCIRYLIPDFQVHLAAERFFPHELSMDRLHAIDYGKGCYVGQEVTARVHHRGQSHKKLYGLRLIQTSALPRFTSLYSEGMEIGITLGACTNTTLGLLRGDDQTGSMLSTERGENIIEVTHG